MTKNKSDIDELLEKLEQQRDELNLKLHLGKAEAKDLWHETENKWRHLRTQLDTIDDDTADIAKDVGATAILLAEEIKQGYEQLKKLL